jgi:hypothetical protein
VGLAYEDVNTVFFESPNYGNATYVMDFERWKERSRMSKRDVRDLDDAERIVHSSDWKYYVRRAMKNRGVI